MTLAVHHDPHGGPSSGVTHAPCPFRCVATRGWLCRGGRPDHARGSGAAAGRRTGGHPAAPPGAPPLATPPQVDRFNVGAAHSPQLLRALAGPASATSLAHPAGAAGAGSPSPAPPAP